MYESHKEEASIKKQGYHYQQPDQSGRMNHDKCEGASVLDGNLHYRHFVPFSEESIGRNLSYTNNTNWGKKDSEAQLLHKEQVFPYPRRPMTPVLPDEELNSMLQSYLEPNCGTTCSNRKQPAAPNMNNYSYMEQTCSTRKSSPPLSGYDYPSISPGAALNQNYSHPQLQPSSLSHQANEYHPHDQSSPSQLSVDSGFEDFCSPFSNCSTSNSQQTRKYNYNYYNYANCNNYNGYESSSNLATHCSSSDQDLSLIVDQVLDSIDSQFSSAGTNSFCYDPKSQGQEELNGQLGLEVSVNNNNNDDDDEIDSSSILCHLCATFANKGEEGDSSEKFCLNCGADLRTLEVSADGKKTSTSRDLPSRLAEPAKEAKPKQVAITRPITKDQISTPDETPSKPPSSSHKTVGVVEPRVVVKIPWSKVISSPVVSCDKLDEEDVTAVLKKHKKRCRHHKRHKHHHKRKHCRYHKLKKCKKVYEKKTFLPNTMTPDNIKEVSGELEQEDDNKNFTTQHQQGGSKKVDQCTFTETLPEHFRQALKSKMRSLKGDEQDKSIRKKRKNRRSLNRDEAAKIESEDEQQPQHFGPRQIESHNVGEESVRSPDAKDVWLLQLPFVRHGEEVVNFRKVREEAENRREVSGSDCKNDIRPLEEPEEEGNWMKKLESFLHYREESKVAVVTKARQRRRNVSQIQQRNARKSFLLAGSNLKGRSSSSAENANNVSLIPSANGVDVNPSKKPNNIFAPANPDYSLKGLSQSFLLLSLHKEVEELKTTSKDQISGGEKSHSIPITDNDIHVSDIEDDSIRAEEEPTLSREMTFQIEPLKSGRSKTSEIAGDSKNEITTAPKVEGEPALDDNDTDKEADAKLLADDIICLTPSPLPHDANLKEPLKITTATEAQLEEKWVYCKREDCVFWTKKPERFKRHMNCHVDSGKHYVCPDCGEKFTSLGRMLRHDRKVHGGDKEWECRICEAEVTDINVHMRIHKKEKSFKCHVCGLQFRHKHSQVRHLVQHSNDRPFRCQVSKCEMTFATAQRLKEHSKKRHPLITFSNNSAGTKRPILPAGSNLISKRIRQYHPIAPAPMNTSGYAQILPQPLQYINPAATPTGGFYLLNQNLFLSPPQPQLVLNNAPLIIPNGNFTTQPVFFQQPASGLREIPILPSAPLNSCESKQFDLEMSEPKKEEPEILTVKTKGGDNVKFDILERAILEIPDLEKELKKKD